jgi:23S rRNA U2552 (ribose-2'-O)-methylase RlmE/FtsJ
MDIALKSLSKGGHFVAKYFRTGDMSNLIALAKRNFSKVSSFKPDSSRKESSEIYLICINKNN